MTCSACGAAAPPAAKFCRECGTRLEWTCPACGAAVAPEQRFCAECGAPLPGAATSEPAERFASPRGYTPAHLAERILKDRAVLEGERKQVTVLFADVSGFTSLAEALDPEDVHGLMSRAFELMLAEIHRYEGTVNQFLGDGLMALFGAPVAHEDHARRAALAALGMQAALTAYRDELSRTHGIEFRVRMGLNTGLVVVGAIGDNLRMDYTAVGDTTNVAARMQQMAEPGQILVSEATRRLIEPYFALRPLGAVAVKNRAEPVATWELGRPLARAPAGRPLAPLLGRDEALATLERSAAAARSGKAQVVYVVGEAGMGKSRALIELRERLGDSMTWVEARCLSFGQSTAFLPFIEVLRRLFGIEDTDSESRVIEKITRSLESLGERAATLAPYVRFALSVDPDDPGVLTMDPNERRARMLRGVQRILRMRSLVHPLALVIEDLQWIDSASEDYLKTVIDELAGTPGLLILTWRPSYRPPFTEHTYVSRIVLEPLDEHNALQLVRSTLGIEDLPHDLAQLIARKAEGNPFFLEEIGRALLDSGVVRAEGGRLALTRPASTIVVPDRVQDVIAARIDRLDEDQKRTVQVASVIGREFALRLLKRVTDKAETAERALADLKKLEFVYEKLAEADLEYVFKHAMTQDVAYESILHARRRDLHARIGHAIEELFADRLEERAEELAYHFTRGEVWDKAARYARQAGDRATALCVDAKAVEFYEAALEALGRLPASPETARLGIDLRLALRAPLWRAGRLDRLIEVFREAEELATRHDETERLDAVYSFFVQYYWAKGEQEQAIAYGERCLDTAGKRDDLALRVTGHFYLAHAYHALGRFSLAHEHALKVIALLEGARETERFGLSGLPYCGACAIGAESLLELGDSTGALHLVERGERVAQAADHLYSRMPLAVVKGYLLLTGGQITDAIAVLEPAVATCREKKFVGQSMRALTALGHAYALGGEPMRGVPLLKEAIRMQEQAGAFVTRALWIRTLAHNCLLAGELEQAHAAAQEALGFAQRHRERWNEGWALWVLGEVEARQGDRERFLARGERPGAARQRALRHFQDALAIARELGMRPLAEHCEKSLAHLG